MSEGDEIRAKRKKLKQTYGALFAEVSSILFEFDLKGINYETNTDEYEPEVGTILPRLTACRSQQDVRRVIFEEFSTWFGEEEAGTESDYNDVSSRVWESWQKLGGPASS